MPEQLLFEISNLRIYEYAYVSSLDDGAQLLFQISNLATCILVCCLEAL
jgi:hypothetical protein